MDNNGKLIYFVRCHKNDIHKCYEYGIIDTKTCNYTHLDKQCDYAADPFISHYQKNSCFMLTKVSKLILVLPWVLIDS